LVSDIPAGDGNIANLFLQCRKELGLQTGKQLLQNLLAEHSFFFGLKLAAFFTEPYTNRSTSNFTTFREPWLACTIAANLLTFCLANFEVIDKKQMQLNIVKAG
jgi:hypothetical protein